MWESFINDFETFTKDILNNLSKDQLKRIRDYLHENSVFIQKEVRKLIIEGLLVTIYELTPLKWPTTDLTPNDLTTNDPTTNPTTNNPTIDNLTPNNIALT